MSARERIEKWQQLQDLHELVEVLIELEAGYFEKQAHAYLAKQKVYKRAGQYPRLLAVIDDKRLQFKVSNGRDLSDNFTHEFPLDWFGS